MYLCIYIIEQSTHGVAITAQSLGQVRDMREQIRHSRRPHGTHLLNEHLIDRNKILAWFVIEPIYLWPGLVWLNQLKCNNLSTASQFWKYSQTHLWLNSLQQIFMNCLCFNRLQTLFWLCTLYVVIPLTSTMHRSQWVIQTVGWVMSYDAIELIHLHSLLFTDFVLFCF